jgi:hypothetical protein
MPKLGTKRKYITPVIIIVIIGVLVATLIRFRQYSPYRIPGTLVGNPEIILSLKDVEIIGRSKGNRVWSFKANSAAVSRSKTRTEFVLINDGRLYDDNKQVASVTAGNAVYDSVMGDVVISGGVKLEAKSGYKASAERAEWSAYFKQLKCPGKVSFQAGDNKLTGINLVADLRKQEVSMEKGSMAINLSEIEELERQSPKKSQVEKGGVL